ncbi:MAG: cytochrome c3 family protein [Planctomycetes bacterium]|nr:cytochrome c3 family protein [Planctomycetota bacterium]
MRLVRWLLPLVSLAIVLLVTLWDLGGERMGPGPLHPVHAARPELTGGGNCEACHQAGQGIAVAACTKCHTPIERQMQGGIGLHGNLPAAQRARCELCHSEHHGEVAPLIAGHAFALAGYPDRSTYDHRHVDFRLTGAHTGVLCIRCHIGADGAEPPPGGRFLGITQACTECHEDVHRAAFGKDCESCHGQERPWPETPGFRHEAFALQDAHQKVACTECHAPGTVRDVKALQEHGQPVRRCVECHADPHGATAAPTALQLHDTSDCARCHQATKWAAARPTPAQHAAFGFELRGAHATAACASCHGDHATAARWSGAAPALAACSACHEHPHTPALMAAATAAQGPAAGCADCHLDADRTFADGRMTAAQHAATPFPLVAPHGDVACDTCHTGTRRSERFPGRMPEHCTACHHDAHAGQFAGEPGFAECTACHVPTRFVPHAFSTAMHGRTKFPLTGAHDAVACAACHLEVKDGVRTFHGTAGECAACHDDVHEGRFDRRDRPQVVDGRRGCARCHDTAAFVPVAADFEHGRWTGYPLQGAHAPLACTQCHPAGTGGAASPHLGKAAGTTCAACHHDPHAGQFAAGGPTDCARCHDDTSWHELRFDHQRHSRFPLDGRHVKVACAKCHVGYQTGSGPIVRYKPLGTACGDCHKLGKSGEVAK